MFTRHRIGAALLSIGLLLSLMPIAVATAQSEDRNFSLQVSPSPLVTTIKPGESQQLELRIRNNGNKAEDLKIELRSFTIDNTTGQVKLNDTPPNDVKDWLNFESPTFTVASGQWYTERLSVDLPKSAGFSYSFAMVVSRAEEPQAAAGATQKLKGSVAVFTLINVDRPDARRKIDVVKFISAKRVYEYLPASLSVQVRNSGNTIVQPFGNIFIQRSSKDTTAIATLPVNSAKSYILPGSSRTVSADWKDGFPIYIAQQAAANGEARDKLSWNWSDVSKFRIGRYTAKLVAVYNDGQHDVPIQAELQFWVIPWRILAVAGVIILILVVGLWSSLAKMVRVTKTKVTRSKKTHDTPHEHE